MSVRYLIFCLPVMSVFSCNRMEEIADGCAQTGKRFTVMPASHTNISFSNTLAYTEEFNTYTYRNFYNGAGVGIGDVNNDGLPDIFFCGNMVSNKLYLNKGDFEFADVTEPAGLASDGVWSTGVSMADVNGDGLLDIYVCKSGKPGGSRRHNELFINQGIDQHGIPTFTEQSKTYGIDDLGLSTHAAFFDFDLDGDLDLYLLNNSIRSVGGFDLKKDQRTVRDVEGGNKLYRHDGVTFTDVSEQAGIYGSVIGYGLGVAISDVNRDGWPDIFISNDFFEKDYLYINNKNGTFTEMLDACMGEISLGSMGADIADINNDGFPEIFVTEMLPESEARLKTKTIFEDWDKYQANVAAGYHRQFPRNVLQLNRGGVPGANASDVVFSEISRYAGVSATDWSWGALIADLDNDGLKDIFVANGIYKDLTDLDYINFYADPITARKLYEEKGKFLQELIDKIPSNAISNYAFRNNGNLTFNNVAAEWGLDCPSFSNGSAYGDLDNDGDIDLVVNNVNMPPFVLRNNTETQLHQNHFLSLKLVARGKNKNGFGSQVVITSGGKKFYQELEPMRGYQSTVDQRLHFGLGDITKIDSLIIQWPDRDVQVFTDITVNQFLVIDQQDKNDESVTRLQNGASLFSDVSASYNINDKHTQTDFVDFNRDLLLFHMLSADGPKLAAGDVNGDGLTDVFIGSDKNHPSSLYLQNSEGKFSKSNQPAFQKGIPVSDTCAEFFDADQDGDLDLYVGTGGSEFLANSVELADKLYINNGRGHFTMSVDGLPRHLYDNNSCVKAGDFDCDGDLDLFVGVRTKTFQYGMPVNGYLLQNNGHGKFENVTPSIAPDLIGVGMITDACWIDYDLDNDLDLVIVGDWMPVMLFKNENGKFVNATTLSGLELTNGFWNCVEAADIDGDGDPDLVVGNQGSNTRFKASMEKPVAMYVSDFDSNGKIEQIVTTYNGDHAYPLHMRADLMEQLPSLKKKFVKYSDYKEQSVQEILGEDAINAALQLKVFTTESMCLVNTGTGFQKITLPAEAQFAPVYSISIDDYDEDKIPDILLGGNFYWSRPEVGIYDGSKGLFLKGAGNGMFISSSLARSGVCVNGEMRDIKNVIAGKDKLVWITRNDDTPVILKLNTGRQ